MNLDWLSALASRPWLRIALAVGLVIAGLAPVGAPILSESTWRQPLAAAAAAQPFMYRSGASAAGVTPVERSDDGGNTWHAVSPLAGTVSQLEAVRGNEQVVYAQGLSAVWISQDGGDQLDGNGSTAEPAPGDGGDLRTARDDLRRHRVAGGLSQPGPGRDLAAPGHGRHVRRGQRVARRDQRWPSTATMS